MNESNRRESKRLAIPIEIQFWCDATHHQGRIEDLSEGGLYIFTGLRWPPGTELAFTFNLPNSPKLVIGTATVMWTEQMGFGVRFDAIDDESLTSIRALIAESP